VASMIQASRIVIRDIKQISEIREVEELQKNVWGCDDLDVVPLTLLVANRETGAVLIGAYDGGSLVGFVYGFPGFENGQPTHHSHMLAVKPSYRNHNLGYKLKLAQRERVIAQGIDRITWTFDPLQSLNAYFNFVKLGVFADTYKINFYGETTSSFLHQIGTDRLWVTWLLDSEPVRRRLESDPSELEALRELEGISFLVSVSLNNAPQLSELSETLGQEYLSIEIPGDINALQNDKPKLAAEWREATRWAFTEAMAAGYLVKEFCRIGARDRSMGAYVLSRKKVRT
jgi:predicted GNAT superfamily acetyltransferase